METRCACALGASPYEVGMDGVLGRFLRNMEETIYYESQPVVHRRVWSRSHTVGRCVVVVVAKMLPRIVMGLDVLEASISRCHSVALLPCCISNTVGRFGGVKVCSKAGRAQYIYRQ